MKDIKLQYYIILGIFLALFLFFTYYLTCKTTFDYVTKISQIIQMFIGFAAITSAILATAISDKKDKMIKFLLHSYALSRDGIEQYNKSKLTDELEKNFKLFPDDFESHQVYFKITNTSGFTLKKPNITLRVLRKYMHPNIDGNGLVIRSNLYNSSLSIQTFDFADTMVLSNSNLNYLNANETIKIWIRVCLPPSDDKEVKFRVALNADNADGRTFNVKCKKIELLNATENIPIVGIDKED